MELKTLLAGQLVPGDSPDSLWVSGLARDSRRVKPGDVFFAIAGAQVDGAGFAADAVERGAVAVVSDRPLPGLSVPVVAVEDVALALGLAADRLAGEPSREVAVTGVTGTNGKTTTAYLLSWILEAAGQETAMIGTISTRVAGKERASTMTTPCVLETHAILAAARAANEKHLVMEVSSHALDQSRVAGVRFKCAVFTNLTRDHLDYHGSLESYGLAKARLFTSLAPDGVAVLNARDSYSKRLARETRGRVIRYAWSAPGDPAPPAEVEARIVEETLFGTTLDLHLGQRAKRLIVPQIGRFNIENVLAAAAAAYALGVSAHAIAAALEANQGVPGRFERVTPYGVGPAVLVDYAHTPDALERVLKTLRPLVKGRLWVVFGCGGERDPGKRGPMGRAVLEQADRAILTSDNPRGEDPAQIAAEVVAGSGPQGARLEIELDRRAAIRFAIRESSPDDMILIAGKGHELTQRIGSRVIPCDDREIARAAFFARSAQLGPRHVA
ncbi:MAG: UDP-N-acetylmuramoyl-L-alanyl-D-glutamate--2,6-diaminopimelate ligase [Planctomycetes bacterium]|nr:UDP-N-acetylmuramoyl-L-alanyl-D-glutamate--2,6-diaminopimelate ligase [Planctomycetota bacterium]